MELVLDYYGIHKINRHVELCYLRKHEQSATYWPKPKERFYLHALCGRSKSERECLALLGRIFCQRRPHRGGPMPARAILQGLAVSVDGRPEAFRSAMSRIGGLERPPFPPPLLTSAATEDLAGPSYFLAA